MQKAKNYDRQIQLLIQEIKLILEFLFPAKKNVTKEMCSTYIWVGPMIHPGANEGNELVATFVNDETANWKENEEERGERW